MVHSCQSLFRLPAPLVLFCSIVALGLSYMPFAQNHLVVWIVLILGWMGLFCWAARCHIVQRQTTVRESSRNREPRDCQPTKKEKR